MTTTADHRFRTGGVQLALHPMPSRPNVAWTDTRPPQIGADRTTPPQGADDIGSVRADAKVSIAGVSVSYPGAGDAVRDADLTVESGSITALLGPSGCGKTSLLRAIAGLERPRTGSIRIGDTLVSNGRTWVRPERRHVGMVFQDGSLFPHLSVADNIAFGLRLRGRGAGSPDRRTPGPGRPRRARRPAPRNAVRRPTTARRARPLVGARTLGAVARRAVFGARRGAAWAGPLRGRADPAPGRRHDDLRHSRPGRGLRTRRPGGDHARRSDRTVRHSRPALPHARQPVGRRLRRRGQFRRRNARPTGDTRGPCRDAARAGAAVVRTPSPAVRTP